MMTDLFTLLTDNITLILVLLIAWAIGDIF